MAETINTGILCDKDKFTSALKGVKRYTDAYDNLGIKLIKVNDKEPVKTDADGNINIVADIDTSSLLKGVTIDGSSTDVRLVGSQVNLSIPDNSLTVCKTGTSKIYNNALLTANYHIVDKKGQFVKLLYCGTHSGLDAGVAAGMLLFDVKCYNPNGVVFNGCYYIHGRCSNTDLTSESKSWQPYCINESYTSTYMYMTDKTQYTFNVYKQVLSDDEYFVVNLKAFDCAFQSYTFYSYNEGVKDLYMTVNNAYIKNGGLATFSDTISTDLPFKKI